MGESKGRGLVCSIQRRYFWVSGLVPFLVALAAPFLLRAGDGLRAVPVLCYHQVRERTPSDSKTARVFIVPPERFREQIKMLHDSGYHSISPEMLIRYYEGKGGLLDKPVLISFDDGTSSQYANALPVLEQYGFKATFFLMTVTLDKPGYLSSKQVKELAGKGHTIGCHTWDHHSVTGYTAADWNVQLVKPTQVLEKLTGKPVRYFAYPFGLWNEAAVNKLMEHHYAGAFQLYSKKMSVASQYTLLRIIADGNMTARQLASVMRRSFY